MTAGRAVIVGASGGIGGALADVAGAHEFEVVRLGRPALDLDRPASFAEAAAEVERGGPLDLLIVASGLLHRGDGQGPERDWRQIEPDWMLENFRVNAVLPALVGRHFLPLLRREGRSVFAVVTARVGSIGDNRLGGWVSYRASKAAANQVLRTLSIELTRKRPDAIAVALHPGTVDTALSGPFQKGVPPERLFTPQASARHLWAVIEGLKPADHGGFRAWDGSVIPW